MLQSSVHYSSTMLYSSPEVSVYDVGGRIIIHVHATSTKTSRWKTFVDVIKSTLAIKQLAGLFS